MISRTRGGRLVGAIGLLLAAGIVAMVPAAFGPFAMNQRSHGTEEACKQCSQGQCSQQATKPEMIVDGGAVGFEEREHTFTVVWENSTGRALEIKEAQSGCICREVTPSKMFCAPGEKVAFNARVDVSNIHGSSSFLFAVLFANEGVERKMFQVSFRRLQPPRCEPNRIAFGAIPLGSAGERHLVITSIDAEDDESVIVTGEAESSNAKVNCAVSGKRSTRLGTLNSNVFSYLHETEFVVRAKEDELGELKGDVTVPVRYGKKELRFVIPFDGTVVAGLEAKPSRLMFVTRAGDPQSAGELRLYARKPERIEIEQISCDSPAVAVASKEDLQADKACVKALQVTVRSPERKNVDTGIRIRAKVDGQEMTVSVPVKLRVVEP